MLEFGVNFNISPTLKIKELLKQKEKPSDQMLSNRVPSELVTIGHRVP